MILTTLRILRRRDRGRGEDELSKEINGKALWSVWTWDSFSSTVSTQM